MIVFKMSQLCYAKIYNSIINKSELTLPISIHRLGLFDHVLTTINNKSYQAKNITNDITLNISKSSHEIKKLEPQLTKGVNNVTLFRNEFSQYQFWYQPEPLAGFSLPPQQVTYCYPKLSFIESLIGNSLSSIYLKNSMIGNEDFINRQSVCVIGDLSELEELYLVPNWELVSRDKIKTKLIATRALQLAQYDLFITINVSDEERWLIALITKLLHSTHLNITAQTGRFKKAKPIETKLFFEVLFADDSGCSVCHQVNDNGLDCINSRWEYQGIDSRYGIAKLINDLIKDINNGRIYSSSSKRFSLDENFEVISVDDNELLAHELCPICNLSGYGLTVLRYWERIFEAVTDFQRNYQSGE